MLVRADVRVVPDARALVATVIGRAGGTVVLRGEPVEVPATHRIGRAADRDVDAVLTREVAGHRVLLDREHHVEPAIQPTVVVAARIGRERTELPRLDVDRGREAEPLVVRDAHGLGARDAGVPRQQGAPPRRVDLHDAVDRLHHVVGAHAEPLVGRLQEEGVAVVGPALIEGVGSLPGPHQPRTPLRDGRVVGCRRRVVDRGADGLDLPPGADAGTQPRERCARRLPPGASGGGGGAGELAQRLCGAEMFQRHRRDALIGWRRASTWCCPCRDGREHACHDGRSHDEREYATSRHGELPLPLLPPVRTLRSNLCLGAPEGNPPNG